MNMRENTIPANIVIRACNDRHFGADNFIISEVNAELLRRNGIDMTIKDFKRLLKRTTPAFTTHTGNAKKAPLMQVNVYSMSAIKEKIKKGVIM